MMRNVCLALVMSLPAFTLAGCKNATHYINEFIPKEVTSYINNFISTEPPSAEELFKQKLQDDLHAFEQIARFGSDSFLELEIPLRKAADKEQSTMQIRSDLLSFATELNSQNELFKIYHFRTDEGAKLRNKLMQLNYATLQIIQVVDNPVVVHRRLEGYLQRQRELINECDEIKADIQAKISQVHPQA